MTAKVEIAIWSDIMCPWCVIGYKNLEKALAQLDGEIEAEIRWLPFELNPDMSAEGEESRAHIARKYGRSPGEAEAGRTAMSARAAAAGFPFEYTGKGNPPAAMMWNTFDAHKMLLWAREKEGSAAQTRLKLALFKAHFQQRRNIGDRAVLIDIAGAEGLERDAVARVFDDPSIAEAVRAEERLAWENNLGGVPAMVFDRGFIVPGAQEPETYANLLRKVVARRG